MLENVRVWSFPEIGNVGAPEFLEMENLRAPEFSGNGKLCKLTGVLGCVRIVERILTVTHMSPSLI